MGLEFRVQGSGLGILELGFAYCSGWKVVLRGLVGGICGSEKGDVEDIVKWVNKERIGSHGVIRDRVQSLDWGWA